MAMASEANMNGWIERNLRFTIPERFDTILQQADASGILLLKDDLHSKVQTLYGLSIYNKQQLTYNNI